METPLRFDRTGDIFDANNDWIGQGNRITDADNIVRRCNAYDALLEACNRVIASHENTFSWTIASEAIQLCRKAIELAKVSP